MKVLAEIFLPFVSTLRRPTMPQFLILPMETKQMFRKYKGKAMGAIVQRYGQWTRKLAQGGHLKAGDRIVDGRALKMSGGKIAALKPGKNDETPGGFWLIEAKNLKEALALCNDCPHFEFGALQVLRIEGNRRA